MAPGPRFNAELVEFLQSGCALITGFVTGDGSPFATYGWGLDVLDGSSRCRVFVGAQELDLVAFGTGTVVGSSVAVTGASVVTLRSVQLKGPIVAVDPATGPDLARVDAYCDAFFGDVAVVDSIPRALMERLVPIDMVSVSFDVVDVFDQTPGPGAGRHLTTGADWPAGGRRP